MDIKAEIEKVVSKVMKDGNIKEKFAKDPTGTVKEIVGDKVDGDTVKQIAETAKGLIGKGDLGEKISGALGGLLGGKK